MAPLGGFWELADILARKGRDQEARVPATYLYTDETGTAWVQLAGSEGPTPVTGMVTAELRKGDAVEAVVSGGRVSVGGNASSPSVGERVVAAVVAPVHEVASHAIEIGTAAQTIADAAKRVADAIDQHFWTDGSGVHVTHAAQEDWETSHSGPNVLINSVGQLFRDGLNNLIAITTENGARAVSFYDGLGNAAANVTAFFGSNNARIGTSGSHHVEIDANGVGAYDNYGRRAVALNTQYSDAEVSPNAGGCVEFFPEHTFMSNVEGFATDVDSQLVLQATKRPSTSEPRAYPRVSMKLSATRTTAGFYLDVATSSTSASHIQMTDGGGLGLYPSGDIGTANTFYNSRHSFIVTTTAIDNDTTLSADTGGTGMYFREDYGQSGNIAYIRSYGRSGTDRKRGLQLGGHNINNSAWNLLYLLTDEDGNRVVQVSEAAPWRTALGLGSFATKSSITSSDLPTVPISKGGTGKTSRADALVALGAAYGAGDTFTGSLNTAGFVTGSGKSYYFTIPLVKGIEGTLTLTSMSIVVRQNNNYLIGTASGGENVKSVTTVSRTAHGLGISVAMATAPSNVTNNSSVGVNCSYGFSVS